ncbi:ABC transporter permease [bacterium]|nr:MAG: ABC transporter permease [bacterium]
MTVAAPRSKAWLSESGPLIAFLVLYIFAAIWQPAVFLNPSGLRNLVGQNVGVGLVAIGMTLVVVSGGIDLSVGSMIGLVGALGMTALNRGTGGSFALFAIVCLALGPVFGYLNGLIVTLGRIAPFVATLAGLAAYRSLALVLADGGQMTPKSSDVLAGLSTSGIPLGPVTITWAILLFLVIAALAHVLLAKTVYGRHLQATGANEQAARFGGINTDRIKRGAYAFLGLCVGLAALAETSRQNSLSSSQAGVGYELDAIAAVVIGGANLSGGRGRIFYTVIGVLFLGTVGNLLVAAGISPYWQGFVKGVIILFAVLLGRTRRDG